MSSIPELRKEIEKAAKIKNAAERGVRLATLIAEALRSMGQDPVLVGGAAVEFYTQGGYTTADLDMLAEGGPELFEVMKNLGFEKLGKDFANKKHKIYVEFPGRSLGPSERDIKLQVDNRYLRILSIEDLVVDRLAAFKFWQSAIDGLNAMKLIETGKADLERVEERAKEEKVFDALQTVNEIREEVIRKKLVPNAANRLLESKMKSLKKR